jgi:hypothetical protein
MTGELHRGPCGGGNPNPSVARVWPTNNPGKGWPLATRLWRAKGLDRACCSAFVSHQEGFDGEVRAAQARITVHVHRAQSYTNYRTLPTDDILRPSTS